MRRFLAIPLLTVVALSLSAQRTPDGQPDLQGIWTNATITPFERPASLAGKATLTEEEARALERQSAKNRDNPPPPREGDVGTDTWLELGTRVVSTRQT